MQQLEDPNGVDVLNTLFFELSSDAERAIEQTSSDPSQFNKRAAFRAVFAAVEGTTRALKHQVTLRFMGEGELYSDAEKTLLLEDDYFLDERGEAKTRQAILPPKSNFIFALKMFMREMPAPLELDLTARGWQAFVESLKVRHRVTHPTKPSDIEVSDKEFEQLCRAQKWIRETTIRNIVKALLEYRHKDYRRMEENLPEPFLKWLYSLTDGALSKEPTAGIDISALNSNLIAPKIRKVFLLENDLEIELTPFGKDFCQWRRNKTLSEG